MRKRPGLILIAVLAALAGGFLSASLANRLAWERAPDLPAAAERAEIAQLALPGVPVRWDDWAPDDPGHADRPFAPVGDELTARHISAYTAGTPETDRVTEYVAGLRERLRAAGWTVVADYSLSPTSTETGEYQNDSWALTARTDRVVLDVEDWHDAAFGTSTVNLRVYRMEPAGAATITYVGGLIGAVLAALLAVWVTRRTEIHPVARVAAVGVFGLGLLALLPALAFGQVYLETLSGDYVPFQPLWFGLAPGHEFSGPGVVAVALLVIAPVIALCGPLADRVRVRIAQPPRVTASAP